MIMRQPTASREGLEAALGGVNQDVRVALETTHGILGNLQIPHVLIGGLAVGFHGHPCATRDVDWLVRENDAFDGRLVITFKPGVPIRAGNVVIDYLTPEGPPIVLNAMAVALETSEVDPFRVVVASAELLTWMKLKAGRGKDIAAIIELLHAGQIDADSVRVFLVAAGNKKVLDRFDAAVQKAAEEDDETEEE